MPRLSLHIKTTEGGIIKDPSILLSYIDKTETRWLIEKMMKLRRVDMKYLAERSCEPEEIKVCSHPYRAGFLMYDNWDALISDERKWTEDQTWLEKLEALKVQFPQFDRKGGEHGQ